MLCFWRNYLDNATMMQTRARYALLVHLRRSKITPMKSRLYALAYIVHGTSRIWAIKYTRSQHQTGDANLSIPIGNVYKCGSYAITPFALSPMISTFYEICEASYWIGWLFEKISQKNVELANSQRYTRDVERTDLRKRSTVVDIKLPSEFRAPMIGDCEI